jgi:hypothetical protein
MVWAGSDAEGWYDKCPTAMSRAPAAIQIEQGSSEWLTAALRRCPESRGHFRRGVRVFGHCKDIDLDDIDPPSAC